MALWQGESVRKPSGGRLISARKKRRFEVSQEDQNTFVGAEKVKAARTQGGGKKLKLLAAKKVSVTDQKTGKAKVATIKTVTENPANIHYVRRNIVTKGAVVDTDAGKVRITSRPGQHGALSGVLV